MRYPQRESAGAHGAKSRTVAGLWTVFTLPRVHGHTLICSIVGERLFNQGRNDVCFKLRVGFMVVLVASFVVLIVITLILLVAEARKLMAQPDRHRAPAQDMFNPSSMDKSFSLLP